MLIFFLVMSYMIPSRDAGQCQQVTTPSQPHNHEGGKLIPLLPFCTCTVFHKSYEMFSTLL